MPLSAQDDGDQPAMPAMQCSAPPQLLHPSQHLHILLVFYFFILPSNPQSANKMQALKRSHTATGLNTANHFNHLGPLPTRVHHHQGQMTCASSHRHRCESPTLRCTCVVARVRHAASRAMTEVPHIHTQDATQCSPMNPAPQPTKSTSVTHGIMSSPKADLAFPKQVRHHVGADKGATASIAQLAVSNQHALCSAHTAVKTAAR